MPSLSIALSSAQRQSLVSLQQTDALSQETQQRLATGRKVNSVVDDTVSYFRAKSLTDRAADFNMRKTLIDQGVSTLETALEGIATLDKLVKQMKGIVEAARDEDNTQRKAANARFLETARQVFELIEDVSYQGLNLLNSTGSQLDVAFGVRTASRIQVSGIDLNSSVGDVTTGLFSVNIFSPAGQSFNLSNFGLSGGSFTSFGENNSALSMANDMVSVIDKGISRLRTHASNLGANVAIMKERLDFTNSYVNAMKIGSDKLTLADLNEEGAKMVALETRQQLGIQSLAVSGQQQQAILTILQ